MKKPLFGLFAASALVLATSLPAMAIEGRASVEGRACLSRHGGVTQPGGKVWISPGTRGMSQSQIDAVVMKCQAEGDRAAARRNNRA